MANWTKNDPSGTATRRQWNIEDRASLKNLKYHFASDGCSDVQYDLARQLLETNSEPEQDERASHVQGIHWLLCAAQQGHEDALEKLRECYKNRRGINDSNENDVKTCLFMTNGERAARKAARELFACLSNGGEHITPAQLERKMRTIYKLQKRKRNKLGRGGGGGDITSDEEEFELENKENYENDNDGTDYHNTDDEICNRSDIFLPSSNANQSRAELDLPQNEFITEDNLVTAAVNYSRGYMPTVNGGVLTLSVPRPNLLDHVPCFHRIIFHPIIFLTLMYHRLIKIISSFPGTTLSTFKLFILFGIYVVVSNENFSIFVPMAIYYFCLIIMIWSTFKMLKTKHDFIDFRIWSGLFLRYGDNNVEDGNSENQFLRNNMKPYLYFFSAFIINLIIYPMISNEWLPNSEITVISFALIFITMIAFMYTSSRQIPDILILFSFCVNVLAKYPYETDAVVATGWRFLDLKVPTFCSFVVGNGIEFCLNCRAAFYLMIPGIMIHLGKRSNWHGIYIYLIPHCVTLSWLQICITSSQSATMYGLMRATLGLAGIMLFLPLFGIITLMIPIFVTIDWLGFTDPKVRIATSITAALFGVLGSCFMAINHKTQKYVTHFQIGLFVSAAALLTLPYMTTTFKTSRTETSIFDGLLLRIDKNIPIHNDEEDLTTTITWDKFYNYCGQPSWEESNKIRTQFKCSNLEGVYVKWEGVVQQVEIIKISNIRNDLIKNYLPIWLGNIITCFYGDRNIIECDARSHGNCDDMREYLAENKKCNVNKWNIYEYEIKIKMHSGILTRPGEVYLKMSNFFGNFSTELRSADRIWFSGNLLNKRRLADDTTYDMVLGVGQPVVDVQSIGCIDCQNRNLGVLKLKRDTAFKSRLRDLTRGIKYLLNVVFNPLITFK